MLSEDQTTSPYDWLTRSEMLALLKTRDMQRKLGLVWERDEIDADRAVDRNFVVADLVEKESERPAPWDNLVIEGDNYDTLRWLRMTHRGRIKCIYVDPPYNTGNKDWVYNDDYVDPAHRFRNSQWLEFLFRRFELARDLLAPDGVLLCSINDTNRAILELMMDQALPGMKVGSLVWRTKDSANDADANFSSVHEHILVYGNSDFSFLGLRLSDKKYTNPDNDPRGKWSHNPITKGHTYLQRENTYYPIQDPETGWWYPCNPASVWRYATKERLKEGQKLRTSTIEDLIDDDRIVFSAKNFVLYETRDELLAALDEGTGPADGKGRPLLRRDLPDLDFWVGKKIGLGRPSKKLFWEEKDKKVKPVSSFVSVGKQLNFEKEWELVSGKQGTASDEIIKIFGMKAFEYPKPTLLIKSIINATTEYGDTILDFFAGSATTAQAVMELNAEDGLDRRFIMASSTEATVDEPGVNICRDVTAQRIRLLNKNDDQYENLSAGFAYLRCREINPLDLDDELTPASAWTTLEQHHGLPATGWQDGDTYAVHESELTALVLVDRWGSAAETAVRDLLDRGLGVHLYAYSTGQVDRFQGSDNLAVYGVVETLKSLYSA